MSTKTTLPATEVRKNFFDILDAVSQVNMPYTITVKGKPKAVIMNAEEYESWVETLDIMSDPEAVRGIEEGLKDLREGKVTPLDKYMAKRNLAFVRDKSGEYKVTEKKTEKKQK